MLRRLATLGLVLAAALAAAAGPAQAQRCEAPPGTAAVDQYCEMLPEERGTTPSARYNDDGAPGAAPTTPLGRRLADQGFDGVALAAFVERTRPQGGVRGATAAAQDASLPAPSNGPVRAIRSSVAGGPVTGPWFLLALLAAVVLVGGLWALDRRRPRDGA